MHTRIYIQSFVYTYNFNIHTEYQNTPPPPDVRQWNHVSEGVEAMGGCVHKRRALNTRLSSGTSAGTFAVSTGPYRNYQAEAGTKIESDTFFVPVQRKGWKIDPHVSNLLRSHEFFFRGIQVHPEGANQS